MARAKLLCTFQLADLYLGVDVLEVQEVLRFQEMTPVPRASEHIRGLINLRGQIVTAIDLRRRMGLPELDGAHGVNVILRAEGDPVSLLVDQMGDVVTVDDGLFEPAPDTLRGAARELIQGVYKLERRLLLVLDTAKLLSAPAHASRGIA